MTNFEKLNPDQWGTLFDSLIDVEVTQEAVIGDAKSGLAIVPDLQALEKWDEKEKKFRNIES